jgi:Histidine kinase-, DNA gyrase B-, and HSP90-like ATPase
MAADRDSTQAPVRRVEAAPEKRFFVSMLVKDIELIPAIVDLVDNSIDGAKGLRPDPSGDRYSGLEVSIALDNRRFEISDNCGGIDVDHARRYAFRFGRPEEWAGAVGEVGQFGVGMKRALFKLGTHFRVDSTSEHARFSLPVSVSEWMADPSLDWTFEFQDVEEGLEVPEGERGTMIVVDELHPWVSEDLANERFLARLRAEIELREMVPLHEGLAISLNGIALRPAELALLSSDQFRPIVTERDIPVDGQVLHMRLYAGLVHTTDEDDDETGEAEKFRAPSPAGWYLFCNDRLLLARDVTRLTGWGEAAAAYHPQYRQFRGYVFLAGDAKFMPWTTTKTAVDEDSSVFRELQTDMFDALQKALTVMNRLKAERQQRPPEERPAVDAMKAAVPVPLDRLSPSTHFELPPVPPRTPTNVRWIRYSVEREDFDRVAEDLGTDTPADVGRETFRFYLRTQVGS